MSAPQQRDRMNLRGRVAFVTGASSGIGEAIAELLSAHGVHLALFSRRADRLEALAQRLVGEGYGETLIAPGDIRHPEDVERAVYRARERWGHVDIVIANAGLGYRAPIAQGDTQRWKEVIDTNIYGLLLTLKYGIQPLLQQGSGHVIVTSSIAGRSVIAGGGAYSGSKFAATAIAEALRQEVAPFGVRVSTIEPGTVKSAFAQVAGYPSEVQEALAQLPPLMPADIAQSMLYVLQQPAEVDVAELVIYPTRQIGQALVSGEK